MTRGHTCKMKSRYSRALAPACRALVSYLSKTEIKICTSDLSSANDFIWIEFKIYPSVKNLQN